MESEEPFCPMSPMNPFLDKFSVDFTEEDDNETVVDFGLCEDNQTNDDLNQIHKVFIEDFDDKQLDQNNYNNCKPSDSDVEEIVANSGDDLLLGSQLMANKYLNKRPNNGSNDANDVHKECETDKQKEKELRIELEMELELERQQRIQFQKQLEEYMGFSLRKQFDDSKQIKSLKFELLKCRQELEKLRKSFNNCNDFDINSNELKDSNESSNKSKEKELSCLDCNTDMKSEISMCLHLINHCIEEEEFQLETTVFRLDEFTDSMVDSIRKSVSYCCPRCNQSFNCLDVYYHLYKCHTKERPLVCAKCRVYCTHLDYWREHNQSAHNGALQTVTYVDISKQRQSQRPQVSKSHSNGINSAKSYKPYTTSRPNVVNPRPNARTTRSTAKMLSSFGTSLFSVETSSRSMSEDDSDEPEVIQLSDSPTPPQTYVPQKPSHSNYGSNSGAKSTLNAEFECDFAECDFKTTSKDKLDFHISAHTNSKFKCPYCPYVGNILNDIYRHIQKSKKHDGLKVYECRECTFGTNCLSSFKEHLHKKHFDNDSDDDQEISEYITDMFRNQHSTTNDDKSDESS